MLNAKVYLDDPSIPLTFLGEEWRVVGGAEERWVEADSVTTLAPVACGVSSTGRCLEYRQRTRHSEVAPGEVDAFVRYRGTSEVDERVPRDVGELMSWAAKAQGPVDGSGPIGSVRFAWQTLPPGSGSTYELYESETWPAADAGTAVDGPDGEVDTPVVREFRERLVVDAATRLPIRWTAFERATGELVSRRIFSYSATLLPRSQFPADFFTVARPATPSLEKVVEFMDAPPGGAGGAASARMSSAAAIDERGLCFDSAESVRLVEQPLASAVPKPDGSHLRAKRFEGVYARYRLRDAAGRCTGPPRVAVRSADRAGDLAAAWRQSYSELGRQTAVQPPLSADRSLTPVDVAGRDTVWLLALSGKRSGFYADKRDTAVVITGPLSADDVPGLLQEVEVR